MMDRQDLVSNITASKSNLTNRTSTMSPSTTSQLLENSATNGVNRTVQLWYSGYHFVLGTLMGIVVLLFLVMVTSVIVYKLKKYRQRQMQSMMRRLPTEDEARLMFSNPLFPDGNQKTELKGKLVGTNSAINGM